MLATSDMESLPRRLVRLGVARPRAVLAFWAAVCIACAPALLRIKIEASAESVLDKAAPAWGTYQRSLELFGGDEIVVVALESDDAFSQHSLEEVARFSRVFEDFPGVRRVDSVATQPTIYVNSESALELDPPLLDADEINEGAISRARLLSQRDRIIRGNLVDSAQKTTAINLVLEANPAPYYPALLKAVNDAMSNEASRSAWVSGVPVFQQETSEQTRSELLTFAPLALVAVAVLIVLVYGSMRAALGVVAVGLVANHFMLSAIGLAGTPMSFTMVILPPLVVALAAAYGMHVLTAASVVPHDGNLEASGYRIQEFTSRIAEVAPPVALSGLTTTIGFLASSLTGVDAVRYVGSFGAVGVLATTALTLTLLPAVLTLDGRPLRRARGLELLAGTLAPRLARSASERSMATIATWAVAAAVASFGILLVHVDTDATRWFETGTRTRDDYENIRSALAGISPINVIIETQSEDDSILEADTLRAISELSEALEQLPEVGKTVSIADPLIQIHEGFSATLPQHVPTGALAEQYLLLLESVDQIDDLVSADRTAANILVRVDNNGSAQILDVAAFAESWWLANGPAETDATSTGVMFEFARAQDSIAWGQILGLSVALVAIAVILVATFREAGLAFSTFLPNAVPLLFIYGAMGTLDIPLDAGTVLVGSLALGIAVDDTIHVTFAFIKREGVTERQNRLAAALAHALPAITYTTLVVGAAFLILALSDFTFVRNLGVLMASVMTICLIADISLLPALLHRFSSAKPTPSPAGI